MRPRRNCADWWMQTRVEHAVIDLAHDSSTFEQDLAWITTACGRRLTRPERISQVVEGRPRRVLRYGWADVAGRPCEVAEQVAAMLRIAGWAGQPAPCRPACPLTTA